MDKKGLQWPYRNEERSVPRTDGQTWPPCRALTANPAHLKTNRTEEREWVPFNPFILRVRTDKPSPIKKKEKKVMNL